MDAKDWNKLTAEEKEAIKIMKSTSDVSPEQVTNQVLKLCNVVRESQDVNGTGVFMKKRSGMGGYGGRDLSPELKIRFGTFGFKKPGNKSSKQGGMFERLTTANTIQVSGHNQHSSQAARGKRYDASSPLQLKDLIETNDSSQ